MAQYKYTAALNASDIPLISKYMPRSVLIPQFDGRLRDPSHTYQDTADNNPSNVPQIVYAENIIPTKQGVKSVGYVANQAAFPGAGSADDVFVIRNASGTASSTWFFAPAQGMNYVAATLGVPWVSTNPLAGAPVAGQRPVSVAEVNGISYICYFGLALLQWNGVNFIDCSGLLTGIVVAGILAIASSGNYLVVAYSDGSIKWSSLTNPLDFVPSVATGAGSQIPIDCRGTPLYLSQVSGGFLIHCRENTVAAVYTQNVAQPWIFREVKNSGGFNFSDEYSGFSRQTSTGSVYEFGISGLQQLDLREATNLHPQVTDFITGRVFETFDSVTNLLALTVATRLTVKVAFLANRYLCISYGTTLHRYNYALIYDASLRRWGKLKIDHTCFFSSPLATTASDTLNVLQFNGSASRILFDNVTGSDAGVVILGRYQLARSRNICSEEVEIEVQDAVEAFNVTVAANYDGATVGEFDAMTLYATNGNYRRFQKQIEGVNLSYIIKGVFNLSTLLMTVTKGSTAGS